MPSELAHFESVARRARLFSESRDPAHAFSHPFQERNIAAEIPAVVRRLFDDGHYAQATFEAYKFVDNEIRRHSGSTKSGVPLMMDVLGGDSPTVKLTSLHTVSEQDEQKGYQFLFAGAVLAIRNPRGHEYGVSDDPDLCLDHLCLASLLIRRLADAGYK
jgi:uncharacterized protein (TIGR02391 family)